MGDDQPQDINDIVARFGTFLTLLGIFFMIVFVASDAAKQPNFDYLFLGMAGLGFGILLRRRATPPPPSGRFEWYRKLKEKSKQRKEEKNKKKEN
ncbi:MAG: hypothetical protein Kow002_01460 [Anaerolineales bacterium]